jgi:hypothetical protein
METSFTGEDRCSGIPVQYHLDNSDKFAGNCMGMIWLQLRYKIYNYQTYGYRPDYWTHHFLFREDALRGGVSSFLGFPGDLKKFVIAGC